MFLRTQLHRNTETWSDGNTPVFKCVCVGDVFCVRMCIGPLWIDDRSKSVFYVRVDAYVRTVRTYVRKLCDMVGSCAVPFCKVRTYVSAKTNSQHYLRTVRTVRIQYVLAVTKHKI